jgi:hypothetical protein
MSDSTVTESRSRYITDFRGVVVLDECKIAVHVSHLSRKSAIFLGALRMPYYGVVLKDATAVIDGNLISAAGVTAGLDGALVLVSLLRGDAAAQEIQLAIEYAPTPIFDSGTPESAPAEVLESFRKKYEAIGTARETEAIRYASGSTRSSSR